MPSSCGASPPARRRPSPDESARLYDLSGGAQQFAAQQPIERELDPAEVAKAIGWVAGPAGAALTGADIPVDGGLAV